MSLHKKANKKNTSKSSKINKTISTPPTQTPLAIVQRFQKNPNSLTHSDIKQLHATIGNKGVKKLVQKMAANNTAQRKESKGGLPGQIKSGIEEESGIDASDIKVHYNSSKPSKVNALAYAQGSDIYLGPGQEKHLPHEAWHTVQQKQGRVKPTTKVAGAKVNDDVKLEKEADKMGKKIAQFRSSSKQLKTKKSQEVQQHTMQKSSKNKGE